MTSPPYYPTRDAEAAKPCPVCESAHALCLSGASSDPVDFIRAAIITERKAKERADALRAEVERLTAMHDAKAEALAVAESQVARLRAALAAEREACDAYRIGGGNESWNKRRHDYCLPLPGGIERDNRCNVCKGVDARRAAEQSSRIVASEPLPDGTVVVTETDTAPDCRIEFRAAAPGDPA